MWQKGKLLIIDLLFSILVCYRYVKTLLQVGKGYIDGVNYYQQRNIKINAIKVIQIYISLVIRIYRSTSRKNAIKRKYLENF